MKEHTKGIKIRLRPGDCEAIQAKIGGVWLVVLSMWSGGMSEAYRVGLCQLFLDSYNACRDIPNPEAIPKLVEACRRAEQFRECDDIFGEIGDFAHEALKEAGIE